MSFKLVVVATVRNFSKFFFAASSPLTVARALPPVNSTISIDIGSNIFGQLAENHLLHTAYSDEAIGHCQTINEISSKKNKIQINFFKNRIILFRQICLAKKAVFLQKMKMVSRRLKMGAPYSASLVSLF